MSVDTKELRELAGRLSNVDHDDDGNVLSIYANYDDYHIAGKLASDAAVEIDFLREQLKTYDTGWTRREKLLETMFIEKRERNEEISKLTDSLAFTNSAVNAIEEQKQEARKQVAELARLLDEAKPWLRLAEARCAWPGEREKCNAFVNTIVAALEKVKP